MFNAGFLVVRPSTLSQQLYQNVRQLTNSTRLDDQKALNKAMTIMQKRKERAEQVLRVSVLDRNKFLSGFYYFEKYGRKLPKLCEGSEPANKSSCPLVVHNNWIVSKEAKIYRFREHLMWKYDGSDRYYSSETRRYLTYSNPKPKTRRAALKSVMERQKSDLMTSLAIGHLLKRVVILPAFHCGKPLAYWQCSLHSLIHVKTFDKYFSGLYRESSFLRHPKVPNSLKQDVMNLQFNLRLKQKPDSIVSGSNVMRQFSDVSAKVINVSNLQQIKIDINDAFFDDEFSSKLRTVFQNSVFRQVNRFCRFISKSEDVLRLQKHHKCALISK